ncbi:hypothetical protein, partial [Neisseria meningitidis]|uniref:hypothetical protein n=1 Tax=Neisseria meningitidis TaxID=487 RepID=UPI001E3F658E
MIFCFCGNDEILDCRHLSDKTEIKRDENLSEITATFPRHSRKSGNLETQSCKNLSKMTEAQKTGFLRKQESGVSGLAKPFYPISFRTDRP